MSIWSEFFHMVLPTSTAGNYCYGGGQIGPGKGHTCSLDELINLADLSHANPQSIGLNLYFRIGQYRADATTHTVEDMQAVKCLVLDVDVRPNDPKHYDDKAVAMRALYAQLSAGTLATPTYIIDSGRGLHVYWATDREMSPAEQRARGASLADKIKALDPKLIADPRPTKNPTTFLRLPGSFNTKTNPHQRVDSAFITLGGAGGSRQCGKALKPDAIAPLSGVAAASLASPMAAVARSVNGPAPQIGSVSHLIDGCKVMKLLINRQQTAARGHPDYLDYDAWRLIVKLMSHFSDGENYARAFTQLSPEFPTFKPDAIDAAIKRSRADAHIPPITCATLCSATGVDRNSPDGCVGCPFFTVGKGSPYTAAKHAEAEAVKAQQLTANKLTGLPVDVVTPRTRKVSDLPARTLNNDASIDARIKQAACFAHGNMRPIEELGISIYPPLLMGNSTVKLDQNTGAMFITAPVDPRDESAGMQDIEISSGAVWPVRYIAVPEEDRKHVQVIVMLKENGQWVARYATLSYKVTSGRTEALITELGGLGIQVCRNNAANRIFHEWFIKQMQGMKDCDTLQRHRHFGWNEGPDGLSFVVGAFRYLKGTVTTIQTTKELSDAAKNILDLKGSVAGARDVLDYIAQHGSDAYRFALMIGAGTPMLRETPISGALINLFGPSGQGKTLIGSTIASLWGSGDKTKAPLASKDTKNSRYAKLEMLHSLPALHDEMTMLVEADDPRNSSADTIKDYLFDIEAGRSKGRLDKTGTLIDVKTWNTIVFGTSNAAIRETMRVGSNADDARLGRTYEIRVGGPAINAPNVPFGTVSQYMVSLGEAMKSNSGVAGMILAEHMTREYDKYAEAMKALSTKIMAKEPAMDAFYRTRRGILMCAYIGAIMLKRAGLWSMDIAEAEAIIDRVDKEITSASSAQALDIDGELGIVLSQMGEYTGVYRHSGGQLMARTISQMPPGSCYEPTKAVYARYDWVVGSHEMTLTIIKAELEKRLKPRTIRLDYMLEQAHKQHLSVRVKRVAINEGFRLRQHASMPALELLAPPVDCVVFTYAVDPNTQRKDMPIPLPLHLK